MRIERAASAAFTSHSFSKLNAACLTANATIRKRLIMNIAGSNCVAIRHPPVDTLKIQLNVLTLILGGLKIHVQHLAKSNACCIALGGSDLQVID
ncbi:hypothetical protein ACFQS6_13530 [Xanthomonas populi]|uniref:hypothetical protein n=1 Tax=Xanthomonas populi TaxID=53414 RepID=UPI000FF8A3D4|nr:hypothetical protein [Xanthomonas populi]